MRVPQHKEHYQLLSVVQLVKLLKQQGADVLAACFIVDLPELGGADKIRKLGVPKSAEFTMDPANPLEYFREATWEEALDLAAGKLKTIRDTKGKGALANEWIVIGAHYDHVGYGKYGADPSNKGKVHPGADDNASGTSALLATARWVHDHPLASTVVFAAFDAEELGLRGSDAFVHALPFPREHLRLNINLDMVSRRDAGRLFVSGVRYDEAMLRPVVEAAARTSAVELHVGHDRPMLLTGLVDDWTSLSDHSSFHDLGVPFLYFGVEDHPDYHRPTDDFVRVDLNPKQRAGVITHPYLLAAFSYNKVSSPIHRGVFLTRNIVGRTLRPPPIAVAFKDAEFKANLTMREKITELTRPQACQSCHSVINPLGFTLENFDAVGRFREKDGNRPVDAAADYVNDDGGLVHLRGARDVAEFAVKSEHAHTAFIEQLFSQVVKQSVSAYGADTLNRLHAAFVQSGYNIQKLLVEIVTLTALPGSETPTKPTATRKP